MNNMNLENKWANVLVTSLCAKISDILELEQLISVSKNYNCELIFIMEALWVFIFSKFEYIEEVNLNIPTYRSIKINSDQTFLEWIEYIHDVKKDIHNKLNISQGDYSIGFQCLVDGNKINSDDLNEAFSSLFMLVEIKNEYELIINIYSKVISWPGWRVKEILDSYMFLISNINEFILKSLKEISVISPGQKKWLESWNDTNSSYDKIHTIPERIRQVAIKNEENTAIISNSRCLTYGELDILSDYIASQLIQLELNPKLPIAVLNGQDKCWELIVAILGILKSGLFYLPISSSDPRSKDIIKESKSQLIIVQTGAQISFLDQSTIHVVNISILLCDDIKKNEEIKYFSIPDYSPESIAYLLYTSGSTGKPKGVAITHTAVLNTLDNMKVILDLKRSDKVLAISGLGFDLSVFDIFGSFISGAAVVLLDEVDRKNPQEWMKVINTYKITLWNSVPSLMTILLDYLNVLTKENLMSCHSIKKIVLSGDLISPLLIKKIKKIVNPQCIIFALGGSTEASIWSIGSEVSEWDESSSLPYGRPLRNQNINIIDRGFQCLPAGALGEIVISGMGLAKCYWGNDVLTEARFPILKNLGRAFLCRDLGVINSQLSLAEFKGRLDRQIKLQGHRLDINEIERVLTSFSSIDEAIVLHFYDIHDDLKLIAILKKNKFSDFYTSKEIRIQLLKHLPKHMIPTRYQWLDSWPLTKNGKIDIDALTEKYTLSFLGNTLDSGLKKIALNSLVVNSEESISTIPAQQGMIYEILKRGSGIYNMAYAFHYNICLDNNIISSAFTQLILELEALRQVFVVEEGSTFVSVKFKDLIKPPYYYFDWKYESKNNIETKLLIRKNMFILEGFPIDESPAFRIEHFNLPDNKSKIYIYASHLLFEAGSVTRLVNRLNEIYNHLVNNTVLTDSKAGSYKNYLQWRKQYNTKNHLNFWVKEISQLEDVSLISENTNKIKSMADSSNDLVDRVVLDITDKEKLLIKALCDELKISEVVFFQGCWSLFIAFYLNQFKVVSGLVYSGRNNLPEEYKDVFGLFINTLPLIISIDKDKVFSEWLLEHVKKNIKRLKSHDIISLSELNDFKDTKILEYFDSVFTSLNFPRADMFGDNGLIKVEYDQITQFPLTILFDPEDMGLRLDFWRVNFPVIKQNIIASGYRNIIKQAIYCPSKVIQNFNLIAESIKPSIILGEMYSHEFDVVNKLSELISACPFNMSYIDNEVKVTYSKLYMDVKNIAIYLKNLALEDESIIIISLPRGYSFILTILACLYARITFSPASLSWPVSLLNERISQAKCKNIISNEIITGVDDDVTFHTFSKISDAENKETGCIVTHTIKENNIAYVLFTSGSSGKPKGVKISYAALNNNIESLIRLVGIKENDIWLSITETTFDIIFFEILAPLCVGGALLFPKNEDVIDGDKLHDFIEEYSPTYLQTTASHWKILLNRNIPLSSFNYLLVGGEPLTNDVFSDLLIKNKKIINLYGPTEATIWSTFSFLKLNRPITIGKPINNTWCVVINGYNQILPQGSIGELCIGGAGLFDGYLDFHQTQDSFVNILMPCGEFKKAYRTGDKVWLDCNDEINFLGRNDRQLKIRGQRIDPTEIEKEILDTKLVEKVIVLVSPDDNNSLTAYMQCSESLVKPVKYSVFCFPETSSSQRDVFKFYKELALKADALNFFGIWIPERHFDEVGSPFSAPAIVASSLASVTEKIIIGAGSIILPLHHPIEVLEQWSTLDCLSNGRIRLSVASGWHPDDFIFEPQNYSIRKNVLYERLKILKESWESGIYQGMNGKSEIKSLMIFPKPIQKKCPLWISVASDKDVFIEAGRLGVNILTHLLLQDIDELSQKISAYRQSLMRHGFDSNEFNVTLMIHTYVYEDSDVAYERVIKPLEKYFRSHFRLLTKISDEYSTDSDISDEYFSSLVNKFIKNKCLIGCPEEVLNLTLKLNKIGVDEVSCLVDFGLSEEFIFNSLKLISDLSLNFKVGVRPDHFPIENLIEKLRGRMPEAMIPNNYIFVDKIPLTSHGKVDFKNIIFKGCDYQSLLKKTNKDIFVDFDFVSKKTYEIWCDVLRCSAVNINNSFFDNGGHSLRVIEMLSSIEAEFNVKISINQFLKSPFLMKFVGLIRAAPKLSKKKEGTPVEIEAFDSFSLSPMQKSIWVFSQLYPEAVCYNDAFLFEVSSSVPLSDISYVLNDILINTPIFSVMFYNEKDAVFQKKTNYLPIINFKKYNCLYVSGHGLGPNDKFLDAIKKTALAPFSLTNPPLIRVEIHHFLDKAFLLFVIHHLLTDGKSLLNILEKIEKELFTKVKVNGLLSHDNYFSYAQSQAFIYENRLMDSERTIKYISEMKLSRVMNSFTGRAISVNKTFLGFHRHYAIDVNYFKKIKELSSYKKTSVNNILLIVYARVLLSLVNEDFIQIILPISLRDDQCRECIGLFINFGMMSFYKNDTNNWSDASWVMEVNHRINFILENRDVPFSKVVNSMPLENRAGGVFFPQFVFNAFENKISECALFKLIPMDFGLARFDVELQVSSTFEESVLTFIFSNDLFTFKEGDAFVEKYKRELSYFLDCESAIMVGSNELPIINYWHSVYEKVYNNLCETSNHKWVGWRNSIDNKDFDSEVMVEWLNNCSQKINRQSLGKVLEIGCGSGAILSILKNNFTSYIGVDFSASIISENIKNCKISNAEFRVLKADEIDIFGLGEFDTIILNSVVQYFPSLIYLENIIKKSISLISSSGGKIYIGDVRNLELQSDFYEHVKFERNKVGVINDVLLTHSDSYNNETELFVTPKFFYQILNDTRISAVLVEPKFMSLVNELSLFRFDVSLYVLPQGGYYEVNANAVAFVLDGSHVKSSLDFKNLIVNNINSHPVLCIGSLNVGLKEIQYSVLNEFTKIFEELKVFGYILLDPIHPHLLYCFVGVASEFIFHLKPWIVNQLPFLSQVGGVLDYLPSKNFDVNCEDFRGIVEDLLGIWGYLFGEKNITQMDNFFDLGGDSMLFIRLFNEITTLGYKVKMTDLISRHLLIDQATLIMINSA